jgi:TPP-dependent pyruvate/acetoin dehydrogenase alpha subunit
VIAVYEATRRGRELCLRGEGPFLMECKTFRVKGHAEHDDPSKYVPEAMFEEWKKKDPIDRYVRFLLDEKVIGSEQISQMEAKIESTLEQARAEALKSPAPPASDVMKGVYA